MRGSAQAIADIAGRSESWQQIHCRRGATPPFYLRIAGVSCCSVIVSNSLRDRREMAIIGSGVCSWYFWWY